MLSGVAFGAACSSNGDCTEATGVNVMSVTAVTDLPRWRMRIQVRINIIVFVKIMDYSSVFQWLMRYQL
jgi:hypothetical protein